MPSIPHPSKEQVRAYMLQRETAHRPPPAPDEIRRQLGWCGDSGAADGAELDAAAAYGARCFKYSNGLLAGDLCITLPGKLAQLATLLAVEWLFLAAGVSLSR